MAHFFIKKKVLSIIVSCVMTIAQNWELFKQRNFRLWKDTLFHGKNVKPYTESQTGLGCGLCDSIRHLTQLTYLRRRRISCCVSRNVQNRFAAKSFIIFSEWNSKNILSFVRSFQNVIFSGNFYP